MKPKTKTAIFIALSVVFAVGSIGSLVNLSGIVYAYESADNNHKVALWPVVGTDWSGARPICEVKSC